MTEQKYKLRCRRNGILITTKPQYFDVVWKRLFNPKIYSIDKIDEKQTYIRPLTKACKICSYYNIETYPYDKDCMTCSLFTNKNGIDKDIIEKYRDYKINLNQIY